MTIFGNLVQEKLVEDLSGCPLKDENKAEPEIFSNSLFSLTAPAVKMKMKVRGKKRKTKQTKPIRVVTYRT
jgi:hypothetical protein